MIQKQNFLNLRYRHLNRVNDDSGFDIPVKVFREANSQLKLHYRADIATRYGCIIVLFKNIYLSVSFFHIRLHNIWSRYYVPT